VVTPVFYNPAYLEENPDAWAITGRGEKAKQDWVEFVCPSREDYRHERGRDALSVLERTQPDGLSLDFVRHFVFWEMVRPEGSVDPLDTTCFCPHCLGRFQRETGVALPPEAAAPPRAAEWLLAHQREAWIRWRAGLITSWVRDLARAAHRIAPHMTVGVHVVPWGPGDYDDGLLRVAGQGARRPRADGAGRGPRPPEHRGERVVPLGRAHRRLLCGGASRGVAAPVRGGRVLELAAPRGERIEAGGPLPSRAVSTA
jgi:hypothetical protein